MRPHLFLWLFFIVGVFEVTASGYADGAATLRSSSAEENSEQNEPSAQSENSVTIPGPLRSFLRMAGLRQKVSPREVLPILARNVVLHGYQIGRPTEYLILLRRYFRQAKEISALAGPDGNIHREWLQRGRTLACCPRV